MSPWALGLLLPQILRKSFEQLFTLFVLWHCLNLIGRLTCDCGQEMLSVDLSA